MKFLYVYKTLFVTLCNNYSCKYFGEAISLSLSYNRMEHAEEDWDYISQLLDKDDTDEKLTATEESDTGGQ